MKTLCCNSDTLVIRSHSSGEVTPTQCHCQWKWEKAGFWNIMTCQVPSLPHQKPSNVDEENRTWHWLSNHSITHMQEGGCGLWTYLKIHTNTLAISFGKRRVTGVRHQPGYIRPLLWRQFTAPPLTQQDHWKCWHKSGKIYVMSKYTSTLKKTLELTNLE